MDHSFRENADRGVVPANALPPLHASVTDALPFPLVFSFAPLHSRPVQRAAAENALPLCAASASISPDARPDVDPFRVSALQTPPDDVGAPLDGPNALPTALCSLTPRVPTDNIPLEQITHHPVRHRQPEPRVDVAAMPLRIGAA